MFCYRITNLINSKKYIGITIDYQRRWKEHIRGNSRNSLIHKAINKYGEENFLFEIVNEELSLEEAEKLEIKLIKEEKTLSPDGYNIAKGGMYGGTGYKITDEEVLYIKSHRDIPEYVLYDMFSDIICYGYFKQIYQNKARKDIIPTVDMYPNNLEFSCQFTRTKLSYYDILDIRDQYSKNIDWKIAYEKYQNKVAESTFWDIYTGRRFKLIRPEVFTEKNKRVRTSIAHSGEKNSNSKLKKKDVIEIRKLFNEKSLSKKEINKLYPQVSYSTIVDIINYKTWKNI